MTTRKETEMSTKPETTGERAQAVPLLERLRSVPAEAILKIDTPNPLGYDTQSIPVGALCHEAASLLADGKAGGEVAYWRDKRNGFALPNNFGDPFPEASQFYEPLYTRPQQAAQVAQPLTEEQVEDIFARNTWASFGAYEAGVRDAERCHGIGKDQAS